jgi:hypothetical protein
MLQLLRHWQVQPRLNAVALPLFSDTYTEHECTDNFRRLANHRHAHRYSNQLKFTRRPRAANMHREKLPLCLE